MKTHLLIIGLILLMIAPGVAINAAQEEALLRILQSSAGAAEKGAACQRLRTMGTARAVPALAALLEDERLSQAARHALEGIDDPVASKALRGALGKTQGVVQAGIIDSLGWRRDSASIPALEPLLASSDPVLAAATARALGRIGGPDATAILVQARESIVSPAQPALFEALLVSAESLLADGNRDGAMAIYRDLFQPARPAPVRIAAWRGLASSGAGPEFVLGALRGIDRAAQWGALQFLRETKDAELVQACLDAFETFEWEAQLAVLDASVGTRTLAPAAVQAAANSSFESVRAGAWLALGALGDPSLISGLASAAAQGGTSERMAARRALAQVHGAGVREALLAEIERAGDAEKVELLIALGERAEAMAAPLLLRQARIGSEPVRRAALESLGELALPSTVEPLLQWVKSASSGEAQAVVRTLQAICRARRENEAARQSVISAWKVFPSAARGRLLPLLPELGTSAALEAAEAAANDNDIELAREAVRVLARWPNAAPAPGLLVLAARTQDPVLHTLALRGSVQVAEHEAEPEKRLALLERALAEARRPDEKKLALAQIGHIPSERALQTILQALADPMLAREAGLAAAGMAAKLSDPNLKNDVADRVLAVTQDPEVLRQLWGLRSRAPAPGAFIQEWHVSPPYEAPGATGAQALFGIPFAPEQRGAQVEWKPAPRGNQVNLAALFPDRSNCAAYLRTRIVSVTDQDAVLLLGSDDGVQAWLNGTAVHSNNTDRGMVPDQDMAPIHLKKGANELLLKITQGGGGWSACARLVSAEGQALEGVKVDLEEK